MVVFTESKVLLFIFITIAVTAQADDPWLTGKDAGKCGPKNLLPDGRRAQCNPQGSHPCCGKSGWWGNTPGHCACKECIDYRKVTTRPTPPPSTTAVTSPTASSTASPATTASNITNSTINSIPNNDNYTTATPPTIPPTPKPTTLEVTTPEPTTPEPTTPEPTTPVPTTLKAITTPNPEFTPPTTFIPESSSSLEITPGGEIDGRAGKNLFPSQQDSSTSTVAGGEAGGHGMDDISTTDVPLKPHEGGDAWIGLVIALCVILLIGVACAVNYIRNKRRSGNQTFNLTEEGVGNDTSKKTTLSHSRSGTLPSKDRNPQITISTPRKDSQDEPGSGAGVDKTDGGKSNAAFSENQDETVTKEESKKEPVGGDTDILVEKDNSNDELNTSFEKQADGKGLSNDAFKEDDVVKSDTPLNTNEQEGGKGLSNDSFKKETEI